jgi:hypothetical protein
LFSITLGFAVDLRPPPADPHEEKPPVTEELRRLAFEGVADELKDPSDDEESQRVEPQAMKEEPGDEHYDRDQNRGNTKRVADAIDRMLVATRVLGDPLRVGASA